jgi:hypothetical protein
MLNTKDTSIEIQTILDKNRLQDLKRFLEKRNCLNRTNSYFIYVFHLFQTLGIFTTSFAAGTNNANLVWFGVALNLCASLINVYEKTNNSLLKNILNDIKMIKEGTYIDEGEWVDNEIMNINMPGQSVSKTSSLDSQNTNHMVISPFLDTSSKKV